MQVSGAVDFLKPNVAAAIAVGDVTPALEFLRLRNLLGLYGDNVPLSERLEKHILTINDFVAYLPQLPTGDDRSAGRLIGTQATDVSESGGDRLRLPHTADFLADLRLQADWPVIEIQARRLAGSQDEQVARMAKRMLAEALMHSDESEKREEAARLGAELAADAQGLSLGLPSRGWMLRERGR